MKICPVVSFIEGNSSKWQFLKSIRSAEWSPTHQAFYIFNLLQNLDMEWVQEPVQQIVLAKVDIHLQKSQIKFISHPEHTQKTSS